MCDQRRGPLRVGFFKRHYEPASQHQSRDGTATDTKTIKTQTRQQFGGEKSWLPLPAMRRQAPCAVGAGCSNSSGWRIAAYDAGKWNSGINAVSP